MCISVCVLYLNKFIKNISQSVCFKKVTLRILINIPFESLKNVPLGRIFFKWFNVQFMNYVSFHFHLLIEVVQHI